ncbi:MAG: hypothetical protein WD063_20100 [Pirellulales bacterium]
MNTNRDQRLEAAPLGVRFLWRGDRYAHEIWLLDGARWMRALESVEGSPDDDWPASPPFQSLSVERSGEGRPLALLVGMAGKSHWSASAEIDPVVPCVRFDVACRVRDLRAGPLGSAYRRVLDGSHGDSDRFPLEIEAAQQVGPAQLAREGLVLKIAAVPPLPDAAPRTIRWGYCLRLGGREQ